MIIHVEYGDRNSIVELTEMERSQLKDYVKNEDQIHGFDVSDDRKYNSDNYLCQSCTKVLQGAMCPGVSRPV